MTKYLLTLLTLFLSFSAYNQLGQIDLTFNTVDDLSFGDMTGVDNVQATALQSDGKLIIGGDITSYNGESINYIARLNPDGSLDQSFNVGTGFNGFIFDIKIQSDGKILVGGVFDTFNGIPATGIVRLLSDGSIDNSFNVGTGITGGFQNVKSIEISPNGDIFIAGDFTSYNGNPVHDIVKVNSNGTFDNTFIVAAGFNYSLNEIHLQSNGKLIVRGNFTDYNSSGINKIIRLNQDGTHDTGFNIGTGTNVGISLIYEAPNSKLYIGGQFTSIQGNNNIKYLARFTADGILDPSLDFYPEVQPPTVLEEINSEIYFAGGSSTPLESRMYNGDEIPGNSGPHSIYSMAYDGTTMYVTGFTGVYKIDLPSCEPDPQYNIGNGTKELSQVEVLPNGKLLVGNNGKVINFYNSSIIESPILRLLPDGQLDSTFSLNINTHNGHVHYIGDFVVQDDGKILVCATFDVNSSQYEHLLRFHPDGSVDSTFQLDNSIYTSDRYLKMTIQDNGKIMLGVSTLTQAGVTENRLYRLNTDGSIDYSFNGTSIYSPNNVGRILKILCATNGDIYVARESGDILALNPNGSVNSSFANLNLNFSYFKDIIFDHNGDLIIVAKFGTSLHEKKRILLPSYTIDPNYDNSLSTADDFKLKMQSDGKLVTLDTYKTSVTYGWQYSNGIRRYNYDGTFDENIFGSASESYEAHLAQNMTFNQQNDILLTGGFNNLNTSFLKNGITRIINDAPYDTCAYIDGYITIDSLVSCTSDGGLSINGINGASPYSYNWTVGSSGTSSSLQVSSGGAYICEITDTNNCTATVGSYIEGPTSTGSSFDLNANLVYSEFRPGFDSKVWLNAFNNGCQPTNGQLKLVLDNNVLVNSSYPQATFSGDTLVWDFSAMDYFSTHFNPFINVHTINQAQIGDTVCLELIITPIPGDHDTTNNVKTYCVPVVNGFDPNDKQVYPSGKCIPNYITQDQKLTYKIRFQNTGNSEAININVIDTIDNNLDMNTFHVLGSSHDMKTEILGNNIVNFVFDDIHLIDSFTNEIESNGYLIFEIEPKPNLPHGTVISNESDIYFDFNPPVLTNSVKNTIYDGDLSSLNCFASLEQTEKLQKSLVYPNPFNDELKIKSFYGKGQLTLYSSIGQKIMNESTNHQGEGLINTKDLSPGIYILKLTNNTTEETIRIVKSN